MVSIVGMYINNCYSLGLSFTFELYHIVGFFLKKIPANGDWMVTTIMEWWTKVHNNESNLHILVQHETQLKGLVGMDVTTFLPHNCFLKH